MNVPKRGTKVKLLSTGDNVKWSIEKDIVTVTLPKSLIKMNGYQPALTFSFTPAE